ncbi:unnamed protein product [Parajaminaea phylloscopi]
MIAKRFLSVGLVALCLALASQPASANWVDDVQAGGQRVFQAAFDTWTESDLRSYLLERGIISPASTREQLVVLAKQDYSALSKSAVSATAEASATASAAAQSVYSLASSLESVASASASSVSKTASGAASSASKNANGAASSVSKSAESAASGASKSASSAYVQATKEVQRNFDVNKDYVFSTWKDSELRKWLIDNNVIKSDYQAKRDEYLKLVSDNWNSVTDTSGYWKTWTDSDLRNWLVANGYLKSDAEAKRDELLALAEKHGNNLATSARTYFAWSDAKLREYLQATGLTRLPSDRDGLLRETRARFVPQKGLLDQLKDGVRNVLVGGQDAQGKVEQGGAAASVSASSAASAASVAASSAAARVHGEL